MSGPLSKKEVLVTGAGGEVGSALVAELRARGHQVTATDLSSAGGGLACLDVTDVEMVSDTVETNDFDTVFHLASLLSATSEKNPRAAMKVNEYGAFNLFEALERKCTRTGKPVVFIFPSSIAVYCVPSLEEKASAGAISEDSYLNPMTHYGRNKLAVEAMGRFYEYRTQGAISFRGVRYPGLLSALTLPSGGSTDYAPAMMHAAVRATHAECFVRPDAVLPFMAMPDAIKGAISLSEADVARLTRSSYNIASFSASAREIFDALRSRLGWSDCDFVPDQLRQSIVDHWPAALDDSAARTDWDWNPDLGFEATLDNYMLPTLKARYGG